MLIMPFQKFLNSASFGGIILMLFAAFAMLLANSEYSDSYYHFWETPLSIGIGGSNLVKPLHHWINDGLMAIFFFLVGLETKREIVVGELSSLSKSILPLAAAIGGMAIPALIYSYFNIGMPGESGWGIPMATDIAFALGTLLLLKKRIPPALFVFLTAFAVADDIGAILVIVLFYSSEISYSALMWGMGFLVFSFVLNRLRVTQTLPYALIGIGLWLALLEAGIHATVAGILLAITIPVKTVMRHEQFVNSIRDQLSKMTGNENGRLWLIDLEIEKKQAIIENLENACHHALSPLHRIEHTIRPWVLYLILPLFAFANAGVKIDFERIFEVFSDPVFIGIVAGLVIGKQIGIFSFCWLAVKGGLATLPNGVGWSHIYGASILGGIGFTMSLFIADLAIEDRSRTLEYAKIGIFVASLLSGILGFIFLKIVTRRRTEIHAVGGE